MPGYKVFLQDGGEIREGLTCSYCKLVLKDPVQTIESGQQCCWECYKEAPRGPTNPKQGVRPDHAVEREIAELFVKCPYNITGCTWSGRFKDSAGHEAVCKHVQRDEATSESHQTGCRVELPSEQLELDGGVQEYSTSSEDVRSTHNVGQDDLHCPQMDSSDFQGWVTTLFDEVLGKLATMNDHMIHLQALNASMYDGNITWCISGVNQRIRDAKMGCITSIYSPPFYTGRNGYKMCIRADLNGDGSGEGTHLSIFFVLMKGEYDPLLQWPFESKVSLILVDQNCKNHLVRIFKPDPQSSSFQRPKTNMNVAFGYPKFVPAEIYDNRSYVRDDVMYIKAIIDTTNIVDHVNASL